MDIKQSYQKQIDSEVKAFRKSVDKISNSANPYYADEAVKKYEVEQLRNKLDAEVKRLESEFNDKMEEAIEHASKQASRATVYVNPSDKSRLAEITADLYADLTFASDPNRKSEAFDRFMEKVTAFEDSGVGPLFELKRQLPDLMKKLEGDKFAEQKLRGLYHELASLKTDEEERLEALKADKLSGVAHNYRVLRMVHQAYKHEQAARRSTHTQL
ncbi:Butyryl-CoA dehydrogenase [Bacillus sp. ZZV12-4809]|nr:Butyryl-CoA dehydrogenase [Bacillus sp. ZZV12-4809]